MQHLFHPQEFLAFGFEHLVYRNPCPLMNHLGDVVIVYRFIKPAPPPILPPFGVSALPIPVGCSVDYVQAEGDRLILQIGGGDECRRILIADLRTGNLIGQFQFPNQ